MVVHIQEIGPPLFGDHGELSIADDGANVSRANLLSFDGTNVALADANVAAFDTTFAQFIALRDGKGADNDPDHGSARVAVTRRARLYDSAAGFTANAPIYASGTAGAYTQVKPAVAGDLIQIVGWAFTTEYAEIDIRVPRVESVPIFWEATSAVVALDTGNFYGRSVDAQNEVASASVIVPPNAIAVEEAFIGLAAEASVGTPVGTLNIGSALSGEQHDAVTADTAAALALEGSAADEVFKLDIAAVLNATDIIRPGAVLGLEFTKTDAGTDITVMLGGYIAFKVV